MITVTNPNALVWKHPGKSPISTKAGVLTAWPADLPTPTQADVVQCEAEYNLYFARTAALIAINALRDGKKSLPILSQGIQVDTGDVDAGVMATKIHAAALNRKAIVSITNAAGVATVTTDKNHHIKTDGTVTIAGADQAEYNITAIAAATGKKVFTYPIAGNPISATGTITFTLDTMRFIPSTNEVTFVDSAVYAEIYLDVEEYVDACQVNGRQLKNEVLESTTIAEVDAVDINVGWPDTGL